MELPTHTLSNWEKAIGTAGPELVAMQEEDIEAYLRALCKIVGAEEGVLTLHPQVESDIPVGIFSALDLLSFEARASIALLTAPRTSNAHEWATAEGEVDWSEQDLDGRSWWLARFSVPSRRARTNVIITFLFGALNGVDRAAQLAPLNQLGLTIGAYLRLWQRMRAKLRGAAGLRFALDTLETAVLVVNKAGKLTFTNKAANELLATGEPIRRIGEGFAAADLRQAVPLQVAIGHAIACNGDPGKSAGQRVAPLMALRSGRFGRAHVLCVVPAEERAMEEQDAAAIVYIVDPRADSSRHLQSVAGLFGLSPVETRLACMLTAGKTLQEAAEVMRIKDQTARSYLKQIFLKTDTKRQAELVRLMLTSHLRLERTVEPASMQDSG